MRISPFERNMKKRRKIHIFAPLKAKEKTMSAIQKIRDKYAKWAVVAVALALLGFVLTDYLSTRGNASSGETTVLGVVNGKEIELFAFETKVKAQEQQMQAQGQMVDEMGRQRIVDGLWEQEVASVIMEEVFENVGAGVGKKEINDILFGANPPQDLKERFSNEQGVYNASAAQNAINQIKKSANKDEKEQLNNYIISLERNRMMEKYNTLLNNSVYLPKWRVEKQNTEMAAIAKVSYTSFPYSKITDSTIAVSDEEIEEYISKNKDQYKQDESRSISYILFNAAPTASDSAEIKKGVETLKEEFLKTKEPAAFLARYGSAQQYYDGYSGMSQIQIPNKENIFRLAQNEVFGPYLDFDAFVLAKKIDTKQLPDSVKARHILIQTANPQQGQKLLEDSVAKKRIDSIAYAVKTGARFDTLAKRFSDDKGSGAQGGVLSNPQNPQTNYFNIGQMVKEFNDFCFEGKRGETKVVKTDFGYHLVEILDQKNFQPHYKVAYFAKKIVASDETHRQASSDASSFASDSRSQKTFDKNFDKKLKTQGVPKLVASNIKPNDFSVEGISSFGSTRQLVREVYKGEVGDVLQPQLIGNKYVVAIITDVLKEGTQSATTARMSVEPILRNKKKGEQIIKNLGNFSTIGAAATNFGGSVKTVDSLRFSGNSTLGFEPRVIGAAFNSSNKGKLVSEAIVGISGVYVLSVETNSSTAVSAVNVVDQQKAYQQQTRQMALYYNQPIQVLKKEAKIKDNRKIFY